MASLHFKGKSAVWNHHLSVPYHTLEKDKDVSLKGNDDSENLIIEGDNLLALKALLPKYQGEVKCIYIDPPYNTGNEGWVYNDNVNNPLIKDWFGQVVGKEGEDFTRHDKWLCMMTPRLKLLRDLLSEDGVIFVSVDDNELYRLKNLMDEIFEEQNFLGNFIVNSTPNARDYGHVGKMHEYCLFYSKNFLDTETEKLLDEEKTFKYKDENSEFNIHPLYNSNVAFHNKNRPNLYYPFYLDTNSKNGDFYSISLEKLNDSVEIFPPKSQKEGIQFVWRWGKELSKKELNKEIVGYKTDSGEFRIVQKMRTTNKIIRSLLLDKTFTSRKGTAEVEELFGKKVFDFPKPVELIKTFIKISSDEDSIVLDSFAGSGTTAQAVMELNREDGKNRKFILIQILEKINEGKPAYEAGYRYVHEITRERVKRVIKRDKLETGFSYFKLGSAIDAENMLSGNLPTYNEFAKYVYYLATGQALENEKTIREKDFYVGSFNDESIYLLYNDDIEKLKKLAITLDWAKKTHEKDSGRKVIYAPACYLDEEYLAQFSIFFVGIPYNLFERL